MASRDRTALFLRYREEAHSLHRRPFVSDSPAHPEISDDVSSNFHTSAGLQIRENETAAESATIISVSMEPDWVFSYKELKADLAEMEKMLDELGTLYAQHVLPSFADRDTSYLEQEIHVRSNRLTDLLHSVEQKVRAVAAPPNQSMGQHKRHGSTRGRHSDETCDEIDDEKDVERVIRRNLQRRFATPLQSISLNFRKRQKSYLEKLRQLRESYGDDEKLVSVSLHDEPKSSGANLVRPSTYDDVSNVADNGAQPLSDTQLMMVENAAVLADERKRELALVAHNINDLATLVKDIAALVVDQGTVLDRVDYNLEETRVKTMAATRELRIADRYQRKRHALCCIIILSIGCGIMTIILIYKWTS